MGWNASREQIKTVVVIYANSQVFSDSDIMKTVISMFI